MLEKVVEETEDEGRPALLGQHGKTLVKDGLGLQNH